MDKPPRKWYEYDTEGELGEHSLVAIVFTTKYRSQCDKYEEYRIDEVGDVGYGDPELVHDCSESEEISTRPVRGHEPSCEHDSW